MEKKILIEKASLKSLLKTLNVPDRDRLLKNVKYFSEKEAQKRAEIVKSYFSSKGLEIIVDTFANTFSSLPSDFNILDVGSGTGFFTQRVMEKLNKSFGKAPIFWALDITPGMLLVLSTNVKDSSIIPILGLGEKIKESLIFNSSRYIQMGIDIPMKFQGIMSVLALHHCADPEKVFTSMDSVLAEDGLVAIVDECKHPFEEYRDEMLDIHLGFDIEELHSKASKVFKDVQANKLRGVICESSGRKVEMFALTARRKDKFFLIP
ncbi:MAG: methyltransferase domain-containing protein [Acidobacteriota bacterium]